MKVRWRRCPDCRRRMRKHSLGSEDELAMLLAHEIAHVKHRDVARGLLRGLGVMLLMAGVESVGPVLGGVEQMGIDFDYFCTGHYARIVRPEEGLWGSEEKPCMIACASDVTKDQAYFLYRISSKTLEKVRFPLAFTSKKEVFQMAK